LRFGVLKWVTTKVEEEYSVVSFNDIDILPEGEKNTIWVTLCIKLELVNQQKDIEPTLFSSVSLIINIKL